jgi:hypothetical protein
MGTFAPPKFSVATEICFEYEFFGDFKSDLLLGSKASGGFCVVEFEDGGVGSVFKKQLQRKNPEWSARFEHGFSQLVDWFFNLHDFRGTHGFQAAFGSGHVRFTGLLVAGRSSHLDDAKRTRLNWRSERVLIDSHSIICITFDQLYEILRTRFDVSHATWKTEPR